MLETDIGLAQRSVDVRYPRVSDRRTVEVRFGIELLTPRGWVPQIGAISRHGKTYASANEAIAACIRHWERTGRAARPCRLPDPRR